MALILPTSDLLTPLDYNNRSASEQAYITALIDVASTLIEKYCNRVFLATDYTDELQDGTGEGIIFVANPPVNSLTDVDIVSKSYDGTTTTTTYTDDKFEVEANTGKIEFLPAVFDYYAGIFPEGTQNIKITYNGGFASVPSPIQFITAQFVMEKFSPSEVSDLVDKEKIGDYFYSKTTNFQTQLIFRNKHILNMYKIFRV